MIGDSTIDNRVWVSPGIVRNVIRTRLGIKSESSAARIKKSHRKFFKPELSVVEHLRDMMPDSDIHDHTNDGFTTTDVLYGGYRDKVFGKGTIDMFPHDFFLPLDKGKHDIDSSDVIVLSVGGNNVRVFLQQALSIQDDTARQQYFRDNFEPVMNDLKEQYLQILKRIREINPHALIITMTQYYPSMMQNDYQIYSLMNEVGRALNFQGDATDVIHQVILKTYTGVLNTLDDKNICVADVTSTLNPFDSKNHVKQIEPSGKGGKKIAELITHIVSNRYKKDLGQVFYATPEGNIDSVPLNAWTPKHPHEFTNKECHDLLKRVMTAQFKYMPGTPMHKACDEVIKEANEILAKLVNCGNTDSDYAKKMQADAEKLKASLNATLKVLDVSYPVHTKEELTAAVNELKQHASKVATGKSSLWGKLAGALLMLVGAAVFAFGLSTLVVSGGVAAPVSGVAIGIGAAAMVSGAGLFAGSVQRSLSSKLSTLAEHAEKDKKTSFKV